MKPLKPGASLPALLDHEAEHAERVANIVNDALGSCRHPSVVAEVCAILLARVIGEHGIRDADAVEPLTLTLVNDVVQRINALGLANLAIVKAMTAAKRPGH
jgi:hypothetical protein